MSSWDLGDGIVELPDGRRVRGRGLKRPAPDGSTPDYGVYLTAGEPRIDGWPYRWLRWRDFRLPRNPSTAIEALYDAHDRCSSERVEIACSGGVGRTGTAIAVLAIMSGIPPEDAVEWVRRNYHRRAVETPWQRRWVANLRLDGLSA